MTQAPNFGVPRSGPATPTVMAERIDDSLDALLAQNKGPTAPSYAVAGTRWWDDSVAGTITIREYDGADWIAVGTIDEAGNLFTPAIPAGSITPAMLAIGGPLSGFRNLLINALGTINQRGYSSGAATSGANQYTVDRWRVVTSGQNLSWSESEAVRTFTAPAGGFEQVIEGEAILTGDYVLNWEGTAIATVNDTPRAKGESFTLTGGANATVRFIEGTVSKMQLEPGTVSTPFERRHPGIELALCQRYYEEGLITLYVHATGGGQETRVSFPFSEPKRAVPTVANTGGSTGNLSSASVLNPSVAKLDFLMTSAGSGTYFVDNTIFIANAEL